MIGQSRSKSAMTFALLVWTFLFCFCGHGTTVVADESDTTLDSFMSVYFYKDEPSTVVQEYINEENGEQRNLFMNINTPYVVEFYSPTCVR